MRHQIIQQNVNKFCLNKYLLIENQVKKEGICQKSIN